MTIHEPPARGRDRYCGSQPMLTEIDRTLAYDDPERGRVTVSQEKIADFSDPVVILGDPGLGKTILTVALGRQSGATYVEASTFVHTKRPDLLVLARERVIVDGLDQVASAAPGGAVDAVLGQLSAVGYPPFILSCREADWFGAADRARIEGHYGAPPVLLRLMPFTRDEALAFLSHEFPGIDAADVLASLEKRGIESLSGNPLTLKMLGEVARAGGDARAGGLLPRTRAELYDRACRVMLREVNRHHSMDSHARKSEEELLLAAGAVCGAQLLCVRIGIWTGGYAETPRGYTPVADLVGLPHCSVINEALRTRLFQSEGEHRFAPIHRVIAEYLGGKWLARCFDSGVSEQRFLALFRQGDGVPTSLRGLHAWIAHFSEALAPRCIDSDPYAVLRYGDAETLSLGHARALLSALDRLSEQDPYFRSEDWGRHPASGLMRPELRGQIVSIMQAPDDRGPLADLLLEGVAGTDLAREIAPELQAIVFDATRWFSERAHAWEALRRSDGLGNNEAAMRRLVDMSDPDSVRFACNILGHVGLDQVPREAAVETVLAHLGFPVVPGLELGWTEVRQVPDGVFRGVANTRLVAFLDDLMKKAIPLLDECEQWTWEELADLVRGLAARVLEGGQAIDPARLWSWVSWMDHSIGYASDARNALSRIFRENRVLRSVLLEHVLLTPCADSTWEAGHRLSDVDAELFPTPDDVAVVLQTVRERAGDGQIDPVLWKHLLLLGRPGSGFAPVVHDAAIRAACGNPKLVSILDDLSNAAEPEWKAKRARRKAERDAKRERDLQSHRTALAARREDIARGDIQLLYLPAAVYLGRGLLLGGELMSTAETAGAGRVREYVGDDLGDEVLAGFIAALHCMDLPSAKQIAQSDAENKRWKAQEVLICGVAEWLRGDRLLSKIEQGTLAAAYMAWQRTPESGGSRLAAVGPALENALFRSNADWETHFRTSIEPQLDRGVEHVRELDGLTSDPRLRQLAGRLATEWLGRYSALPPYVERNLLTCAIENAPDTAVRAVVVEKRLRVHPDYESALRWLSADYAVDFNARHAVLRQVAADDPDFLWHIRDCGALERTDRSAGYGTDQLAFIVEAFACHWAQVEQPIGVVVSGDRNPHDASEFIRRAIYAIAARPEPDATEALQVIICEHARSYRNTAKHALALQLRARRDTEYAAPGVDQLKAVLACDPPEGIDDLRAWFRDQLEGFQARINGSDTDMRAAYWAGGRPHGEEYCRDRMIEHIGAPLPPAIRLLRESSMPDYGRADIAIRCNQMKLPVEIKGQWHRNVWDAASSQLDARYTSDWQAECRGVYIVLWFGDIPGRALPSHPEGLEAPTSPSALVQMLIDRLPESRRASIDVFVVDFGMPPSRS